MYALFCYRFFFSFSLAANMNSFHPQLISLVSLSTWRTILRQPATLNIHEWWSLVEVGWKLNSSVRTIIKFFLNNLLFVFRRDTLTSFPIDVTLYGLELVFLLWRKGEFSRFLSSPNMPMGTLDAPPHIPPLATVLYEVQVLDFLDSVQVDEFMDLSMVRFLCI